MFLPRAPWQERRRPKAPQWRSEERERERKRDPVVIFQWHTVPNRKSWVNHQKWELTIKNWEMRCLISKNRGYTIKNGGFTIKNGGFTTENRVPQLGTKALSWGSSLCARAWRWGLAAWIPVGTASDTDKYATLQIFQILSERITFSKYQSEIDSYKP